ncbi:MAG: hypothetical protein J1G01_06800 [Clostridiales bacterium]|nr:hypothetical protein [Clostridiales bacterium]
MDCENNRPVEINIPDPLPDYNSDNNIGLWKQLFAANIGKRAKIETALFDGTVRGICGDIYIVGNAYVGVTCGDKICLCDIYSVKFVTFY